MGLGLGLGPRLGCSRPYALGRHECGALHPAAHLEFRGRVRARVRPRVRARVGATLHPAAHLEFRVRVRVRVRARVGATLHPAAHEKGHDALVPGGG